MATDRTLLKQAQAGYIGSTGTSAKAQDVINVAHQTTFTWQSATTVALAETGIRMPFAGRVISAYITPGATLAVDETNYMTWTVSKRAVADPSSAVSLATRASNAAGGGTVTAYTPAVFTLTATVANLSFGAGDVLTFKSVDANATTDPGYGMSVLVEWV